MQLKEALATIETLKKEVAVYKLREARQKAAVKLALAYKELTPEKYASLDTFGSKIEQIVKAMSVEAIETALEEIDTIRKSAAKNTGLTKEASLQDGNVATAIMVQRDTYFDEPKHVAQDTIKNFGPKYETLSIKSPISDSVPS